MMGVTCVLSEHEAEKDHKESVVRFGVTEGGQSVLNASADDPDDAGEA